MRKAIVAALLFAIGAILSILVAGMAIADTYNYDALGRLTNVTRADGSTTTYVYDAAGNRTSTTTSGVAP